MQRIQPDTVAVPAAPAKARGFGKVPCLKCGSVEAVITADLHDLTGDETFRCCECEGMWGVEDVRRVLATWPAVLAWIDSAPALPVEE